MSTSCGAWLGALLLIVPGCGDSFIDLFTCKNPDLSYIDARGNPDPCHRDSPACKALGAEADVKTCAEDSISLDGLVPAETCAGRCVPTPPLEWRDAGLFWFGPLGQEPPCPPHTTPGSVYLNEMEDSGLCSCGCEPSAGACTLPSTLTASTAACNLPGGKTVSFDAPAAWNGACTAQNPVSASEGIRSLTIQPLKMTESNCKPAPHPPTLPSVTWKEGARSCVWSNRTACTATDAVCDPDPDPPPQFFHCVLQNGTHNCPSSYPLHHTVYESVSVTDTRTCSPCLCSDKPHGSLCTAQVSTFGNSTCGGTAPYSVLVSSDKAQCTDVAPGTALLSKVAEPSVYLPGTCSNGSSVAIGKLQLPQEYTVCCLPIDPISHPPG